MRLIIGMYQHVTAADIHLVLQADRYGHWREGFLEFTLPCHDRLHAANAAGRQHRDLIAAPDYARSHLAGKTAKIQVRTDHVLYREPHVREVVIARDRHGFQVLQQGRALIPGHARAAPHHVVAFERADGDELQIADGELTGELLKITLDGIEDVLAKIHQIHFVDGHDD